MADEAGTQATIHVSSADISDEASCARLAGFAHDAAGRVDVLVNRAGFFPTRSFDAMTLADRNTVIGINLTGVFLMTKAMMLLMTGRGWGRIVNLGSAPMFEGVAEQIHYVAAKAAVLGFSRSLAWVVGTDGITVDVVTPGLTLTPKVEATVAPEMFAAQIETRCIRRAETGEDLVGAVFFLASSDADFISGQTVNIDGGKHML